MKFGTNAVVCDARHKREGLGARRAAEAQGRRLWAPAGPHRAGWTTLSASPASGGGGGTVQRRGCGLPGGQDHIKGGNSRGVTAGPGRSGAPGRPRLFAIDGVERLVPEKQEAVAPEDGGRDRLAERGRVEERKVGVNEHKAQTWADGRKAGSERAPGGHRKANSTLDQVPASPMHVTAFGATHSGTNSMKRVHHGCKYGAIIDLSTTLYLYFFSLSFPFVPM